VPLSIRKETRHSGLHSGRRGVGIGAASGAIVGAGVGAANAQKRSRIPAAAIQCVLCAMRGGPEIPAAAIFRTGAGLCAGPRLCPAELSAAGIVKQRHHQ
jgi:hypothetical protein